VCAGAVAVADTAAAAAAAAAVCILLLQSPKYKGDIFTVYDFSLRNALGLTLSLSQLLSVFHVAVTKEAKHNGDIFIVRVRLSLNQLLLLLSAVLCCSHQGGKIQGRHLHLLLG
jgi:hypothetical protein